MDEIWHDRLAYRLQQELAELAEQLQAHERIRLESLKDSTHELSSYDNHPADGGNDTLEREKDLALLDNLRHLHAQTSAALRRLEQGTYGRCQDCEREIEPGRLEAIPAANLCLACRKKEEAWDPPRRRPIEEDVLRPPYGQSFRDGRDYTGFDGEDSWQAVAFYGTSNSPSDVGGAEDYNTIYIDRHEPHGNVEPIEAVIDVGPDEIPPDPHRVMDEST